VLEAEAQALIADFTLSIHARRPWVVAKSGVSLDGRVSTSSGQSQWITSEAARERGRALRGEAQAVAVGIGTVLADDPLLTVRDGRADEPRAVVFDSRLRLPLNAKVVKRGGCVVVTSADAPVFREKRLAARGVTVLRTAAARSKGYDIKRGLALLYQKYGISRLFVEGGPALLGSLNDADLVDEWHLFLAPFVIGGDAPVFVSGEGLSKLSLARRFSAPSIEALGGDVHLHYTKLRTRDRA
jgi:diaminohydroxyphosphoribosylaminopyrimidine deaminase / 5-amino-6-(5-phosphoribosylamino)uracil reductase